MPVVLSINSLSHDEVRKQIGEANIKSVIFAHGLLPHVGDEVLTTIVDEFGRAAQEYGDDKTAFLLALNSSPSLNKLGLPQTPFKAAEKIRPLLDKTFPDRQIVVAQFGEYEPTGLFNHLSISGGQVKVPYGFTVQGTKVTQLVVK